VTAQLPAPGISLGELTDALGGTLLGDRALRVCSIAPLESADATAVAFLANPKYKSQLQHTQAACVIVPPHLADEAAARGAAWVVPDPYHQFALLTQWWAKRVRPQAAANIHPSAVVDASAILGEGVCIGPLAVIDAHARIGDGAYIGPHCVVGARASIGAQSKLQAHVTVGFDCSIGARCILHAGVVIGADGFGFAPIGERWEKIEQLGAVRIGDDVELGANTCVDRGALGDTIIEEGVKIDNLVQIAHNVVVGAHSAMAGCVGVAGSARIGRRCTIGGAASILGHLTLADGVNISTASVVTRSIHKPGLYSGIFPLDDNASWEKNAATLKQLHALRERIRALEKLRDDS
jgi:UDP-3-O-[3-hydroxymyristoyl] glucosamine N-acyltransferase